MAGQPVSIHGNVLTFDTPASQDKWGADYGDVSRWTVEEYTAPPAPAPRPPRTSAVRYFVAFTVDTPSHLAPLSHGYGGWGISARYAASALVDALPVSRAGEVDVQTVPIDEWEHGYVFDEGEAEGSTVECVTFHGWMNHEQLHRFMRDINPCEGFIDTLGILGVGEAYSLELETPSSIPSFYISAWYGDTPCTAPSARRAIRWAMDGEWAYAAPAPLP